jgi:CheY-like chemotaxis protein
MAYQTETSRALILIVDDDEAVRDSLQRVLESAGFEVMIAANGIVAIAKIGPRRPDLVLTDLYMPEADGFELMNWIKSQPETIPIVAMSGGAKIGFDQLGMAKHLGAQEVIGKPFRAAQLIETIERVLTQHANSTRDRRQP